MVDLLTLEKRFLSEHIKPGGIAADCTMGNGHDTCWLSRAVGENGHVYAFDIQEQALASTAELLKSEACPENYTLILDSHENIKNYIEEPICAAVFNLGYLPGGDKSVTTLRPSTAAAVRGAIELLDSDGILLCAVYPGHEEGRLEGAMLEELFRDYDRRKICISQFRIVNSPTSPFFFIAEKK